MRAQNSPAVSATAPEVASQVLVLKSGRVISGRIQPRGNGYDIEQRAGRLFISSEQIWLLADDLFDAHQRMRDSFPSLTPDIHMQIASWCSDNQMWGTARRELLDALHKDPNRADARQMLAKVIRTQEASTQSRAPAASSAIAEAISNQAVLRGQSLGGLSPERVREFTRHIQPLLSNKCAECHQANSDRSFVLQSTHNGSTRAIAEYNLIAVLNQLASPSSGPDSFLTIATSQHGRMPDVPFSGRHGSVQQDRVTQWVERIIQEKGWASTQQPAGTGTTSDPVRSDRRMNDSAVVQAGFVESDNRSQRTTQHDSSIDEELLTDARRRNRNDKFDPDIFNQRYQFRRVAIDTRVGQINRRSP